MTRKVVWTEALGQCKGWRAWFTGTLLPPDTTCHTVGKARRQRMYKKALFRLRWRQRDPERVRVANARYYAPHYADPFDGNDA